jgi:hypothetical protein
MNPCTTCGEPACNINCRLCLKDYCLRHLRQHEHGHADPRIVMKKVR